MIGTERKKGFGSSFATSARFFFRRLWDIVPVQTCVFKNQFDGTNESTDFQSHKSKKRRRLKIDSQHLSRQLKKTKMISITGHRSSKKPVIFTSILDWIIYNMDFWQCGKKVYCRQITCWPGFKKGVENCSFRLRCYLPLLNIAAVDSKIKSL